MSEEGGCRHGIKTDILRISYFIFHILILKSVLVFFTIALTSFDNNLFWGSWKEWKFIYILMSKHNNNYKYQMKSKFRREERLSEGMENTHSDNTLELTGNKNECRCMLCNRNFSTNRGLIQHLNTEESKPIMFCNTRQQMTPLVFSIFGSMGRKCTKFSYKTCRTAI